MPRVSWLRNAEWDLVKTVRVPAVIRELRDNAEVTLHPVNRITVDEGISGKTMWHRGFTHEQELQIRLGTLPEKEGPQVWDFFLFYRKRSWSSGFEVLSVRTVTEVAARMAEMLAAA